MEGAGCRKALRVQAVWRGRPQPGTDGTGGPRRVSAGLQAATTLTPTEDPVRCDDRRSGPRAGGDPARRDRDLQRHRGNRHQPPAVPLGRRPGRIADGLHCLGPGARRGPVQGGFDHRVRVRCRVDPRALGRGAAGLPARNAASRGGQLLPDSGPGPRRGEGACGDGQAPAGAQAPPPGSDEARRGDRRREFRSGRGAQGRQRTPRCVPGGPQRARSEGLEFRNRLRGGRRRRDRSAL
jgi:hypothetical protein